MPLMQEESVDAARLLLRPLMLNDQLPRLIAVQARLAAREGDWQKAVELINQCSVGGGFWVGKAALELYQWDLGLSCLEILINKQPSDLAAQYWFARGLATAALAHKNGLLLEMTSHLPGKHVISAKAQEQFERACQAAGKGSSREAFHWQVIGNAIFRPGLDTIRSLASILPGESEAAAMVAVLREISNLPGAIQVAEQYHDSPEVLLQLALCYLDQETKRGLDVTRKVVALRPNQPIFQVLRAKMSQKMNLDEEALTALEAALEMWPDEAEWHVLASRLANNLKQGDRVVAHWEKALALVPQRKMYAVLAGKAFLTYHQEQKAIQILEEAVEETSSHPRNLLFAWIGLLPGRSVETGFGQLRKSC